jgi:hypothetical protein
MEVLQLATRKDARPLSISERMNGNDEERCQSGRLGTTGNRVYLYRYRGFESLPLRQ